LISIQERRMDFEYIVVLVTVPSAEVGERIARRLLAQRLAACANIVSGVRSLYTWKGAVLDDAELLLVVKTRAALF
jgi:periplasmic divalent cation tolerance protein